MNNPDFHGIRQCFFIELKDQMYLFLGNTPTPFFSMLIFLFLKYYQRQPAMGVLRKRCSENFTEIVLYGNVIEIFAMFSTLLKSYFGMSVLL